MKHNITGAIQAGLILGSVISIVFGFGPLVIHVISKL